MKKKLLLCGCLFLTAALALPQLAAAGPVVASDSFTLAAGATSGVKDMSITAGSVEIDRIVIWNGGAVTCGVDVAALDLGVETSLDSTFALLATNGACQYPPGRVSVTVDSSYVVTGDVAILKSVAVTNRFPIPVSDVRLKFYKDTNAADCVYGIKIFGRAR